MKGESEEEKNKQKEKKNAVVFFVHVQFPRSAFGKIAGLYSCTPCLLTQTACATLVDPSRSSFPLAPPFSHAHRSPPLPLGLRYQQYVNERRQFQFLGRSDLVGGLRSAVLVGYYPTKDGQKEGKKKKRGGAKRGGQDVDLALLSESRNAACTPTTRMGNSRTQTAQ